MNTLTDRKAITRIITRENGRVEVEYQAAFDDNVIGIFRTDHEAEIALNDYVLLLCEQGLVDQPLALMAEDASRNACELGGAPTFDRTLIPSADWGAYATGDLDDCACGEQAAMLLHGVHDTFNIALCLGCYTAYEANPEGDPGEDCPDHGPYVDDCDKCAAPLEWYAAKEQIELNNQPRPDLPNPGRAIARHFHSRPRHFVSVLRHLDPIAWWPLAEAYSAWRGQSVQHTLDVWAKAVSGAQVPTSARP